jgi:hypothetical protein
MPQKSQRRDRAKPLAFTNAVATAIKAMVWEGRTRSEAAQVAGMTDDGLYRALRKPDVKTAFLRELAVLRTSERPRNTAALIDVRDNSENANARVAAAKALEEQAIEVERPGGMMAGTQTSPGVTIQIIGAPPSARTVGRVIEHKPFDPQSSSNKEQK